MKKNLCIVVYDISDMGGTNQVASSLCYEFVKHYNVSVLSIRKNVDNIPHPLPYGVDITVLLDGTKNVKDTTIRCFKPAKEYFKSNKIDVALLIGHFAGFIMSVLRPFIKTKLVFCDHGALVNQWDDREERLMRYLGTKLCHRLVTLTQRTMNDYLKLFHIRKKKVEYIYNWIDFDPAHPNTYDKSIKKVMWAGRFSPEKGNDMMYDVAVEVLKKNPDWEWNVYGDGDTLEEYRNRCLEDKMDSQLHFLGRENHLREKYREHSLYVMTSYREGLPLVLLEAKANDLPIVSFDVITGPAEIVRDRQDGYLIEPKNTAEMVNTIDRLMKDDDERERLARNARGNLDQFSKEHILKKWCTLIDNI